MTPVRSCFDYYHLFKGALGIVLLKKQPTLKKIKTPQPDATIVGNPAMKQLLKTI
jgi:hypothetical protein